MAKKKDNSTTPSNKRDVVAKPKGGKRKTTQQDAAEVEETAAPLQATLGEQMIAKGKKPVDEVQVINFDRRLPCSISPVELKERAVRIGELRDHKSKLDRQLEQEQKDWKQKKESIENDLAKVGQEIDDLTDEIGKQKQYRDVKCQRVFDYKLMQVREVRLDMTPPALLQEPRPMTAREVEEGYTNADGARKPAEPMQDQSSSGDDAIVDDDYMGDTEDAGEIDFD